MKAVKGLVGIIIAAAVVYVAYIFLKPGGPTAQVAEVIAPSETEALDTTDATTTQIQEAEDNQSSGTQESDSMNESEDPMTSQNEELLEDAEVFVFADDAQVEWIGKKIAGGQHNGYVLIEDSELLVANNQIVGGSVVMNMTTIKATDIDSEDLDNHLKAEDFFDVATYPRAIFEITDIEGTMVQGLLTMKGETNTIRFEAEELSVQEDTASIKADFAIDRNQRGVDGNQVVVSEFIELSFDLQATAQ